VEEFVLVRGMPSKDISREECVMGVGIEAESNIPIS